MKYIPQLVKMRVGDNGNLQVVWLGLATFAWSMLFVWQGLDFTDMGFWLTSYQQLYIHPDTIWGLCWLSSFIGHWIGVGLGGGVLAYKLGYVFVITVSAITGYQLLASVLGHSRMLAVMVLLTVFFTRISGGNWVGYNDLTALFYLVGASLLVFGLIDNRKILVALAGVVLGANIFIRLPNILGITLVSAIWLQAWICHWTLRNRLLWSAWFLGGFTFGMILVWSLIVLHGHQAIYVDSILAIFGEAVGANSPHAGSGLVKQLISDHIRAFCEALFILIIGSLIANWASKQKILLISIVVLVSVLLLAYVFYRGDWRWCISGICYIVLLSIIFLKSKNDEFLALLAFIAGMILFITPIGSTNGISNSIFGMWLALPLTLTWLWQSSHRTFSLWFKISDNEFESNGGFLILPQGFRIFVIIIALALLFQSFVSAWRHTYLDSKNRFTMTDSIAHPLLAGTYTTAERAKVITELLDAMVRFVKRGDELLAYNGIPTLYFLTETHPWLGISWPDFEGSKKLTNLIRQKEKISERLPCIVRATGSTYANSWPIDAQPMATFWHQDEARHVFKEFEKRHGYVVVWSNNFFEILTTTQ